MTPAKVTVPNGLEFFINNKKYLNHHEGVRHIGKEAREDLKLIAVVGTPEGFIVPHVWERGEPTNLHTKDGVKDSTGHEQKIDTIYELTDGTKIEPVTEEEMKLYRKGKEL